MREQIEEAIVYKSRALLAAFHRANAQSKSYAKRYGLRTGLIAGNPTIRDPKAWSLHKHFDPRYCISHAPFLARVIWDKLQSGDYQPQPAVRSDIPKADGSPRSIMAFTVPDAALSNLLHRNITKRNLNIFSSYSFAYRDDKGVFDAILHLRRSLGGPKSYVIQYDFSKYFDRIDHAFLKKLLFQRKLFLLTDAERVAISAFLSHRFADYSKYMSGNYDRRAIGVPQGASISLFLANAAAHDLDLSLERLNGTFTRFADDVVAITSSYTDAVEIANQFRAHCKDAGLEINYDKSQGIEYFAGGRERERRDFILDKDDGASLKTIPHIDYVGLRLSASDSGPSRVSLPDKTISRIKRKISRIIYIHLFQHRRNAHDPLAKNRLGPGFMDWDLVTCLNEIRNYVYGGLSQKDLEGFVLGKGKIPHVRGLMGFLAMNTDAKQLAELDGWLVSIIQRAQRERVRMALVRGVRLPLPRRAILIDGGWYTFPKLDQETRIPSFVMAWRAAKKFYRRYGIGRSRQLSYAEIIDY